MTIETQMRNIFGGKLKMIREPMICGGTIMGKLGQNKMVKIRLDRSHSIDNYDQVTVVIVDTVTNQKIDHQIFSFLDAWGKLPTTNPNFKEGVVPHIWQESYDKGDWYVAKPTANQLSYLVNRINSYISYFA